MTKFTRTAAALLSAVAAPAAFAADTIDKADVAWMLVATTLVLFITRAVKPVPSGRGYKASRLLCSKLRKIAVSSRT